MISDWNFLPPDTLVPKTEQDGCDSKIHESTHFFVINLRGEVNQRISEI